MPRAGRATSRNAAAASMSRVRVELPVRRPVMGVGTASPLGRDASSSGSDGVVTSSPLGRLAGVLMRAAPEGVDTALPRALEAGVRTRPGRERLASLSAPTPLIGAFIQD